MPRPDVIDDEQSARRSRPPRGLPTFYYHEHFVEMLDFVASHYRHTFLDEHDRFLRDFGNLPLTAQRLFVRLANRKGRVFAEQRLRYPEIGALAGPLDVLAGERFIGAVRGEHFGELLRFLTKAELYRMLAGAFVGMSRSLRKDELVEFARKNCRPGEFVARLDVRGLLVQRRVEVLRYLLFLYFGRVEDGLSRFTMRDLGLVRTQSFRDSYEPRYADREEALESFFFATRLRRLADGLPGTVTALLEQSDAWPDPAYAAAAAARDRLAYRLGRSCEKAGDLDAALGVYRRGESPDCNERVVRILLAAGREDEAKRFLEERLDDPRSDEEWLFARDVYEQKFARKRTSAVTDVLRAAETIDIDESQSGTPERAAAAHFEGLGQRAYRTENALWRTLFGLLFWQELYAGDGATLHSPFEFLPRSLTDGSFYDDNESRIEARLALLDEPARLKFELLKISTRYYGTPNGIFRWRRSIIDAVLALVDACPAPALRQVLRRFCRRYNDARYGYPDLLVIDEAGARFVEIKAEGDQLRRNQLLRLEQLRAAGLRADVVRIRWVLDPMQTYVVVDIETTGGRGDAHRITEIGAVKLRDGRIIDRFQTLVNPQRTIPAGITRLTGITPEMVADAPRFADIADAFDTFMGDAIFVAHNVSFDYGFISREYARLGRRFRHPRLCTCASMRRLYPGHRSYSLAALCQAYDIPLKRHHRAMCDAEAAAELLLLVNERRLERLG